MLTQSYLIRASLKSARTELSEVFQHITDEMLDWAPTPGMRTIQGQFVEILGTEISIIEPLMKLPKRAYKDIDAELWPIKTVEGLIVKLEEVRNTTLELPLGSWRSDGSSCCSSPPATITVIAPTFGSSNAGSSETTSVTPFACASKAHSA